ncbi:ABC transporter permease [Streptomyces sp. NPDC051561]|uniref:ABC transporter permease n=1 Tax=Streptomyces sp. NPDC051561 TaxID=3365658 RepID=UPI0037AAE4E0
MSDRAVAPWVRTRLRAAPGAAVSMALLVLITAFLAAALPRGLDHHLDNGMRAQLDAARADQRMLKVTSTPPGQVPEKMREDSLRPRALRQNFEELLKAPEAPVRTLPEASSYGVRGPKRIVARDAWLPRPPVTGDVAPAQFLLSAQAELGRHSRMVQGRAPRADGNGTNAGTDKLEAAVSTATAKALRMKPGSVLHVENGSEQTAVTITGIFEPLRTQDPYWATDPLLHTPAVLAATGAKPPPVKYWGASLLLAPEAGPALLHLFPTPERFWELDFDTASLTAQDIPALSSAVASLEGGPGLNALRALAGDETVVTTDTEDLLASFDATRQAVLPVVAVAAFGIGTVAGVVILMAAGLAGARRHAELSLVRSRGGSVRGILLRLLGETSVVAVPAAAVGWLTARLLITEVRDTASVVAAVAVALLASLALPVRAAVAHFTPKLHGERTDLVRARPSRRRTVFELTALVLTVGAVAALNRRGTGQGSDELVSAAPVLVGLIAAMVLVRLYPLPLRLAGRPAALRRGAVGFLAIARAGRAPATAAMPLLALLVALTTAAIGGSVLAGVGDARDRAAYQVTGADARIESSHGYPEETVAQVRRSRGVREVSPVGVDYELTLDEDGRDVTLVVVDPESYARISEKTGLGPFDAAKLKAAPGSAAFPVLATPGAAKRIGAQGKQLRSVFLGLAAFTARPVGTLDVTPAQRQGEFVLISRAALPKSEPNALMVNGDNLDGAALRALAVGARDDSRVQLAAQERAKYADPPLQAGAQQIYAAGVAAGAGYAVLAVLLSLLQAAPERRALLARLRTMGLTRAHGRRLLVFESLPQALLAAVGGALVGWAAVRLLAPSVDLGKLALSPGAGVADTGFVALRLDPFSLLLPAVGVVVIAAGVAVFQAWWTTRVTTTTELRAGDAR